MTPLRQRMLEDMPVRHLSPLTQRAYLEHVSRFARHFGQSPARWGAQAPPLAQDLEQLRGEHLSTLLMQLART